MMKPIVSLCLASGLLAAVAHAGQVSGQVNVMGQGNRSPAITVVYAESLPGPTPVRPGRFKLEQQNKSFQPRILAIPAGSTVDFPNLDPIFHNVFSLSRPASFDLGLYRAGASKSHVFAEPATYRVSCNIHPQMTAVVLVLPTSFIAQFEGAGTYKMELPAGRYRITAWSERASPVTTEVVVGESAASGPDLALDESKYVELAHKSKFGQDYPRTAYDPTKASGAR
jgi:plastocyanin